MSGWTDEAVVGLVACGDLNLQDRDDPGTAFRLVKDYLPESDILFGNCEMCLEDPSSIIKHKPGWIQSDKRMVTGLVEAGFDVLSTANNVNFGTDPILSSIAVLDEHKIAHTGSGRNIQEARRPAIVDRGGVKVGFLAYTAAFFPQGHAAAPDAPGVAGIKIHTAYEAHPRVHEMPGGPATTHSWPDFEELETIGEDIRRLRKNVDVLVVYFHMGFSGESEITEYQRVLAHYVVDQGGDLVLGSSAHLPQAVEVYKDRAIFYGLGNFAFDWYRMATYRSGLLVRCSLAPEGITRVVFKPVYRRNDELNQPEIVTCDGPDGSRIIDTVRELSTALKTDFVIVNDEVVVWEKN